MADIFSLNRLDWFWRLSLAQSTIIILFFMSMIDFSLHIGGGIHPYFLLMGIYYWTIFRPSIIPHFMVFLVGLVFDLVLNFPVGLHSIIFLTLQWIISSQRIFLMGQTYVVLWLGFVLSCLFVSAIEWIFFSLQNLHFLSINETFLSFIVTIFLFPPISLMLILIHRLLPIMSKSFMK